MGFDGHIVRVDVPALRQALETLRAHEGIIRAACAAGYDKIAPADARSHGNVVHERFVDALYRIVDDGFRSEETGGSS